ncbi:MAG: hypothetical protein EOO99_04775 [Pedobacter sp.]|nr:MAG: hypothetical protein EOO99_04775 [Pedobacter sp.]
MKKVILLLILFGVPIWVQAQVVATINDKSISSKEFLWVYKKNNLGKNQPSYEELSKYLDLYLNFKLKVLDAKNLGLDKDPSYQAEIEGYEKALKAQKKSAPRNSEFDFIMNEYREGVLMFNISEQKVWNKATEDEEALKVIYESRQKTEYLEKSFEEVRGEISMIYQSQLENAWLTHLKNKYTIKINESELRKLAKL